MHDQHPDQTAQPVDLNIVIPYRDRNLNLLKHCLQSIHQFSKSIKYHIGVADYGSKLERSVELNKLAVQLKFTVIRSETEGWPWNLSRARNMGAVNSAPATAIMFLDMDMIFQTDIISQYLEKLDKSNIVIGVPDMLGPDERIRNARPGNAKSALGGCVLMQWETFERVGGYDESFEFYGGEDVAFVAAAKNRGFSIEKFIGQGLYHQHHSGRAQSLMPQAARTFAHRAYIKALLGIDISIKSNEMTHLGKRIEFVERPILSVLRTKQQPSFEINITDVYETLQDIGLKIRLGNHGLFKLILRPRRDPRAVNIHQLAYKLGLLRVLNHFQLEFRPSINISYDMLYVALPFLLQLGVRDYFFESSEVLYLLV